MVKALEIRASSGAAQQPEEQEDRLSAGASSRVAEDGDAPQDQLDELLEAFLQRDAKDLLENLFQGKDQHVDVVRLGQQMALKYKQLYEKELAASASAVAAATRGASKGQKSGAGAATIVTSSVTEETKADTDEEEGDPTDPLQAMSREIQSLKEQLHALREVNRIAEARAEDLKRALSAEEKKHKKEIDELKQRILRTASRNDNEDEVHALRNKLKSADEDKNVLVNTFECKELEWKTQIEDMQLEMEEVNRKCESETTRYKTDLAQLEATAREAMHSGRASDGAQDGLVLQSASALSWLRCPMRGGAACLAGELRPIYCQDACWNVVSAISGCVALWCSIRDYTILQASREANRIWSSSMLHEKSFFSLASAPSSVTWLKKAFHSHQRIADMDHLGERGPPGFIVRDLGCEAFKTKTGETFDSSVITAHFPAETACGRPASLLVILEPQGRERERGGSSHPSRPPAPQGGHSGKAHSSRSSNGVRGSHSGRLGSSRPQSEVSTSSVSPSDSASNILGFRN